MWERACSHICISLFYAAIPVGGYALVADNIEPEHRAKAMASLGAANACGLVRV